MNVRSHILSPSVARGIAVMCAAVFAASAHPAQAGINVHGPGVAVVTVLAIDPTTPRTLYAGSDGSVLKSTDGGDTWNAANTGLPFASALAIDPTTSGTLYAGTYQGVYKSTDGGGSWSAANTGLPDNTSVLELAIAPTTPSTLYARTDPDVYKSTDGASSWHAANTGLAFVRALAIDPTTPGTLYAGTGHCTAGTLGYPGPCFGGVAKSTDSGDTWNAANTGLLSSRVVYGLAIDPTTPGTLYAETAAPYSHAVVYKSTDGAMNWQSVNNGPIDAFTALAIDPTTPGTLYAGTRLRGVFKSTDGGSTWNALNTGLTSTSVNALAIDPTTPSTLYAGTYGVSKSTDGGSSWAAVNTGLESCGGDCNHDGTVTVDDLLTMVNIALGNATVSECFPGAGDANGDGEITLDEIITAVNTALTGCGVGT